MDPSHLKFPKKKRDLQYQLISKRQDIQNDRLSHFRTNPQLKPFQVTQDYEPASSKRGPQLKSFQVTQNFGQLSSKMGT